MKSRSIKKSRASQRGGFGDNLADLVEQNNLQAIYTKLNESDYISDFELAKAREKAAAIGNIELLKILFSKSNGDYRMKMDSSYALVEAAIHGHYRSVKYLIKLGADVRAKLNKAIAFATNKKVIELLLEHGARPFTFKVNEKTFEWIVKWIRGNEAYKKYISLDLDTERDLRNTVKRRSYTVYRGFSFNENELKNEKHPMMKWDVAGNLFLGQQFSMHDSNLTSWTTDLGVAYNFTRGRIHSAIILKTIVPDTQVLADLTEYGGEIYKIPIVNERDLLKIIENLARYDSKGNQSEIILKPGYYQAEIFAIYGVDNFSRKASIGGKRRRRRSIRKRL